MVLTEGLVKYKIIRQPYRITMARWDFTVTQKRILTKIISSLQKEISITATGAPIGQLEMFSNSNDSVKLMFSLNDIVKDSNNYSHVKNALQELRKLDVQIVLPATKSKTSKQPEEETILTGLIERAVLTRYSRNVTITIHRATAQELVKATNGLTQFAEEVMYLTNNRYTQKLYEMISHWKDKEVFSISPNDFRVRFSLENKYREIKDLIRRVIKPAEIELKEIADVFFEFSTTVSGRRIIRFNFAIKNKKTLHEEELKRIRLREYNTELLIRHFGFRDEHIQAIAGILSKDDRVGDISNKIYNLFTLIQQESGSHATRIKKVPEYVIKALKNEFG